MRPILKNSTPWLTLREFVAELAGAGLCEAVAVFSENVSNGRAELGPFRPLGFEVFTKRRFAATVRRAPQKERRRLDAGAEIRSCPSIDRCGYRPIADRSSGRGPELRSGIQPGGLRMQGNRNSVLPKQANCRRRGEITLIGETTYAVSKAVVSLI